MKPTPSTLETRRRTVIERAREVVEKPDPQWVASVVPRFRAVVNLGPDPTPDAIIAAQVAATKAHGHPSGYSDLYKTETCSACGEERERVVTVGQEPDYESSTATLCRDCLVEALAALDAAP